MLDLARFIEAFFSHPIHPRLIHFPVALSYLGLLLVLLAWLRRDAFFERTAFYAMFLLALSTIPAGLTGVFENQTIYAGNAPNATLKVIMALLLLLIAAGAAFWRWHQPKVLNKPVGVIYLLAFVVCAGLTTLLGAFGGIIVWGT